MTFDYFKVDLEKANTATGVDSTVVLRKYVTPSSIGKVCIRDGSFHGSK